VTTRAEQETIVQWDREGQTVSLYTAYEGQAKRWTKLGYEVGVRDRDGRGRPTGWEATAEKGCVSFRRVSGGKVIRRQVRPGQSFPQKRVVGTAVAQDHQAVAPKGEAEADEDQTGGRDDAPEAENRRIQQAVETRTR
jgi:hypothetical protein